MYICVYIYIYIYIYTYIDVPAERAARLLRRSRSRWLSVAGAAAPAGGSRGHPLRRSPPFGAAA